LYYIMSDNISTTNNDINSSDSEYIPRKQNKIDYAKSKYIDFKINGRLFPVWVLANFKEYYMPEVIKESGDPCNNKDNKGSIKLELRKYQVFISSYLDYKSPYRNILLYHGLGSGKTASTINIYNVLYNYTSGWNVFLLIKASLKNNWIGEIKKWLKKDDFDHRYKNIIFLHYDSPYADRDFADARKNVDNSKKSLYVIDEVHNFIRNVYSNISSLGGKRAQSIYDYIIQDKKENPDTRVVLISGTPAINNPFELSLLFNLLRPGIFPRSEAEFNHLFVSGTKHQTMNKANQNLFQRRILGLVSYYNPATGDNFATKKIHYTDVPMSTYHIDVYNYYEEIEGLQAQKAARGKGGSQTYKSYTRQACNFVFPQISQNVSGETRPRPGKFRISERDALKLSEGKELKKVGDSGDVLHLSKYLTAIELFITELVNHFNNLNKKDLEKKHTIYNDIETFTTKYKNSFIDFHTKEKTKSQLYNAMTTCSTKMVNIIFNIMMSSGPTLVYSNYVLMEGLQVFKVYLKYFGFYNWMEKKEIIKDKVGYTEFHGSIKSWDDRYKGMELYNSVDNKYGKIIKIMLISPAGAEGLSLSNVRQVHIMEPYWNEVRITQMIGRAIRFCSHKDLPMEERHVDIYRYRSIRPNIDKVTTDQYIEDLARSKDGLIQSFLSSVKESAIDCSINKNHNMMNETYKCFQFDQDRLFDQHIGPAYKENIYDDMKLDNGLNSIKSTIMRIKVMQIKAVMVTSKPDEELTYSSPAYYWYYSNSHTIYDYDLHYTVGKIATDDQNIPIKIDKETYVISHVIPIPLITE
jgi:hypothetical protein